MVACNTRKMDRRGRQFCILASKRSKNYPVSFCNLLLRERGATSQGEIIGTDFAESRCLENVTCTIRCCETSLFASRSSVNEVPSDTAVDYVIVAVQRLEIQRVYREAIEDGAVSGQYTRKSPSQRYPSISSSFPSTITTRAWSGRAFNAIDSLGSRRPPKLVLEDSFLCSSA